MNPPFLKKSIVIAALAGSLFLPHLALANVEPNSRTQREIEAEVEATFDDLGLTIIYDALSILGLSGILGDVVGLIKEVNDTTEKIAETKTPDLETVAEVVYGRDSSSHLAASLLQGRDAGTFKIKQNEIKEVTRETIRDNLRDTLTSKDARLQLKELAVVTADAAEYNADLAENSQLSDVSQHILQNLSQQTNLNGQTLATIAVQGIQAQQAQANQTMLQLQMAESLEELNNYLGGNDNSSRQDAAASWLGLSSPIHVYKGSAVEDLDAGTTLPRL